MLNDIVAASLAHVQEVLPSTFTVDGIVGTFRGVYDRHAYTETLIIGGYEENVDATLVATKAQFAEAGWIPNRGRRVICGNKAHQVVGITEDDASYTFQLKGVHS